MGTDGSTEVAAGAVVGEPLPGLLTVTMVVCFMVSESQEELLALGTGRKTPPGLRAVSTY